VDNQPKEPDGQKQEKKLSRTTLTFYSFGLFSVAIALIMISYVAQARADVQLEHLSTQLNEQQTVAQGISQKMYDLQKQFDVQSKALDDVRTTLDNELAKTDIVSATRQRMEERDVYARLARVNAHLLTENLEEAEKELAALTEQYGEERLLGTAQENAFDTEISEMLLAARQRVEEIRTAQTVQSEDKPEDTEESQKDT